MAPIDPAQQNTADLMVAVDGVHVRYRTFSSGKLVSYGQSMGRTARRRIREVHALRGVSFMVHRGETIGVIGHNGSGKSTLMRAIAGLLTTAEGQVYAAARPALLGVNAALIPDLSGDKNVRLGSLALGFSPKEVAEKRDEIVEFSGLSEFIDLPMKNYSSGQSARLRFSIAMAKTQQILLIDEALSVGDKEFRSRSEARIRDLRAQAGVVFLVSHSMKSILDTCTRVLWIDHGTLKMDGDPATVVDAYTASFETP